MAGRRTAASAIGVLATVAACSSNPSHATTQPTPSAQSTATAAAASYPTAAATVTAYYSALSRHDAQAALQLLSPSLAHQYAAAGADGELTNVVRLNHLRDVRSAPAPYPGSYPGFTDIKQVVATYDVVYRQQIASANGTQIRFLYVGRSGPGAPWRILEIGTGP